MRAMGTPPLPEMIRPTAASVGDGVPVPSGAPDPTLLVTHYDGPADDWDRFARTQRGFTHCHLYGWREVMQRTMAHDAPYLAAVGAETGAIVGVLPLVRVRGILGHYLVSVPFLNYGGPIGSPEAVRALAARAAGMATSDGAGVTELRSRCDMGDLSDYVVSHRKITALLDSSGGSDALWKRLPSKVRNQIRRPQKEGVSVRIGRGEIGPFYKVFSRHMRDLGTPVMPLSFFEAAAEQFGSDMLFGVAYHKGRPIACGAGFVCEGAREFEITWASSIRTYNRMSPNMLVYWELMKHISDAGVPTFNFGRCTPGSNTHRFKTQWGTTDDRLWWYDHTEGGARPLTEHGSGAALAARIWRRLPLRIASAAGPRIVRMIPL